VGDESTIRERLGGGLAELNVARRYYTFAYPFPPSEVVEFFRLYYGPANRTFASLDPAGQAQLRQDLEALWALHNRPGRTAPPSLRSIWKSSVFGRDRHVIT
jgi:hypothetical protein